MQIFKILFIVESFNLARTFNFDINIGNYSDPLVIDGVL